MSESSKIWHESMTINVWDVPVRKIAEIKTSISSCPECASTLSKHIDLDGPIYYKCTSGVCSWQGYKPLSASLYQYYSNDLVEKK